MTILKAQYRGFDGLAGYKSGNKYFIVYKENGFLDTIFRKARIEIWRASNSGLTTGHLKYSSMNTFLLNWDIVLQDEFAFPFPFEVIEKKGIN